MESFGPAHRAYRSAVDRSRRAQRTPAWRTAEGTELSPRFSPAHCNARAVLVSWRALGIRAEIDGDLVEWNYGEYEGKRTEEIRAKRPDWQLFRDGCPGGESPEQIGARADRVVKRIREIQGNVLIFSSGHILRVLTARWLGLEPVAGKYFLLSTASLSALGYEHKLSQPVIQLWNDTNHVGS